VAERYGLVWVCLGEPAAGIVDIPEVADPAYRVINVPFYDSPVSATRLAENFLDAAHFAFVHAGTFGGESDPALVVDPVDDGDTTSYRFQVAASNPPEAFNTTQQTTAVLTRTMTMRITLPFTLVNTVEYDDGLRHVILNALTPVTDTMTRWSMTLIRNDDHAVPESAAAALDLRIVAEDLDMLASIPGPLPLEPEALAHVGADRAAVVWMRGLRHLLVSGTGG
jgi:vanillate O-demethylase monooxygenase subunit